MYLSKKPKIFYGYWIVVVAFFCLFISVGSTSFGFSLFVKPLEAHFGWGRGEIMAGFTILFLIIAVAAPFIGRVVDRYGARGVITIGASVAGLGFGLLGLMNSLWCFYLGNAIVGTGMAGMGAVPASAIVSNWFKKRRGLAIGMMSTGMGIGGFILAPLVGGYLIPSFGWRISYLALALLTWLLIIPLALLVVRTRPADMGLHPDGIEAPQTTSMTDTLPLTIEGSTLRMALASPVFWLISLSYLLSLLGASGVVHNQVPHLEDLDFPVTTAATALGTVALMSAVGKLSFGWLCDRMPAKYAYSIGLGFQLVGTVSLLSVKPASTPVLIWLYAIAMGLSGGAWLPTMAMLTSTTFGLASYGAIFGMVSLFQGTGAALGPSVAGYVHDITNSYHWFFIISLILCVVSIPAILSVRRHKSPENPKG